MRENPTWRLQICPPKTAKAQGKSRLPLNATFWGILGRDKRPTFPWWNQQVGAGSGAKSALCKAEIDAESRGDKLASMEERGICGDGGECLKIAGIPRQVTLRMVVVVKDCFAVPCLATPSQDRCCGALPLLPPFLPPSLPRARCLTGLRPSQGNHFLYSMNSHERIAKCLSTFAKMEI